MVRHRTVLNLSELEAILLKALPKQIKADIASTDAEGMLSKKLDAMLKDAKIDGELMSTKIF